jgi:hypothetical protein
MLQQGKGVPSGMRRRPAFARRQGCETSASHARFPADREFRSFFKDRSGKPTTATCFMKLPQWFEAVCGGLAGKLDAPRRKILCSGRGF